MLCSGVAACHRYGTVLLAVLSVTVWCVCTVCCVECDCMVCVLCAVLSVTVWCVYCVLC